MKRSILAIVLTLTLLLALAACNTHSHEFSGEWLSDETGHWQVCSCGEASEKVAHTGGTATETEKALCEVCGQSYGELAVHVHNYNAVVTAPTCQAGGYTTYTCACGDSYVSDETAKADHSYEAVVTAPTCTEGGYTTYTCSCGDSYVSDETTAVGHNYEAVVTAPTCTEAGYTTYTCGCGDSYVGDEVSSLGHNMVEAKDDTHHWTACANNCGTETEKVAHAAASITASYNGTKMQYVVAEAKDFTVVATCECGATYTVTEGVTVENGTLALGENTVTVKVGELSADVVINAEKFNVVVNGTVADDTYVYSASDSQEKNYASQPELSTNGDNFRVLLKYNFNDVINNIYYNDHKDEATIEFVFTMTAGSIDESTKLTFKAYPVDAVRSGADFSELTWKNYNTTYGFGWGNADGFVNKEAGSPYVTISDNAIIITLTYREIEQYIDENGDALFVFAIWKSSTKIGSVENENESVRPRWTVHFSNEHTHAYIEEVAEEKYLASANCGETAKYYKSCSCGEASDTTFNYGEVIDHSYGEFVETQAPTCTVEGVNTKTCGNCGDTQTEAIPVIPHSYEAVVTDPTCTEAGYTTYTCGCGDTYTSDEVAATGHSYGDWLYDESYHWVECGCGDTANKDTHSGGEATETEQAVCETCNQPYGGLASHVHNYEAVVTDPTCTEAGYTTYTCGCGDVYVADEVAATGHSYGEWESFSPAGCEVDEVLIHYCDCGENETSVGQAAFGHDMKTKYDENNHWTECAHNCGTSTEAVAHFGGEATETEKAVCEGCGQSYGELKPAEKKEYTINGVVVADTDINSGSKTKDRSANDQIYLYSSAARGVVFVDLKDIMNIADFETFKSEGKFYLTFTIAGNESDVNNTKFLLQVANPTYTALDGTTQYTAGIAPSAINWNSIHVSGGAYYDALYVSDLAYLVGTKNGGKTLEQTDKVIYTAGVEGAAGTITYVLTYDEIKDYICMDTASEYYGQIVFKMRASGSGTSASKTLYYASCETATPPTVKFVYEK